jgi:hypothetical protein
MTPQLQSMKEFVMSFIQNSVFATLFAIGLFGASNGFAAQIQSHGSCLPAYALCGNNDGACCSGDCQAVRGDNNNYCAPGGYDDDYGRNECRSDWDCGGRGWSCDWGQCNYRGDGGGWGSCLPSGALCGNDSSACCSRNCVAVRGEDNNYCQ